MANLTRYTYLSLFALTLFVFFIGCGDDEEIADDIGPVVAATPEGIIEGTIIDLVTQQGVRDARVILVAEKQLPSGDVEHEDVASTATTSSGNFLFEELKTGKYVLKISAHGYLGQQAPVEVTRKEPAIVSFRLEPGVRFTGTVFSDDGNPVANVLISLGERAAVTGGGGQYEISPVSKGQYQLIAEKPGYHTTHIPGITVGDRDISQKISIRRKVTGQIVFVRGDVVGRDFFGISAINADRTGEKPLTHLSDLQPTWSPNGREIVFSRSENRGLPQIYIMDNRGGSVRSISGDNFNDRHPAWSPDGRRIAFVHSRALGQPAIYTMNVNGENRIRLADCDADARPTWAPDGAQIAYTYALQKGGNRNLFVVDIEAFLAAKEAPPTTVIPEPELEPEPEPEIVPEPEPEPEIEQKPEPEPDPHQTPDEEQKEGEREGDPPQAPIVDLPPAIEEGVQRLTNSANHDIHPDWNPDGSKLVFTKETFPFEAAVYILDLFSLNQMRLTGEDGYNGYPCWSPDGSKIVFSSNRNGSFGIWMMDADGSNTALTFDELSQDDIINQHAWRE